MLVDSVLASGAQGPHASLMIAFTPPLLTHGPADRTLPALGIGVLLRLLYALPEPAIPCTLYQAALAATESTQPPLLRTMRGEHSALIDAVSGLCAAA